MVTALAPLTPPLPFQAEGQNRPRGRKGSVLAIRTCTLRPGMAGASLRRRPKEPARHVVFQMEGLSVLLPHRERFQYQPSVPCGCGGHIEGLFLTAS